MKDEQSRGRRLIGLLPLLLLTNACGKTPQTSAPAQTPVGPTPVIAAQKPAPANPAQPELDLSPADRAKYCEFAVPQEDETGRQRVMSLLAERWTEDPVTCSQPAGTFTPKRTFEFSPDRHYAALGPSVINPSGRDEISYVKVCVSQPLTIPKFEGFRVVEFVAENGGIAALVIREPQAPASGAPASILITDNSFYDRHGAESKVRTDFEAQLLQLTPGSNLDDVGTRSLLSCSLEAPNKS